MKKLNYFTVCVAVVAMLSSLSVNAQSDFGVSIKAGTSGLGFDLVSQHPKYGIRLGYDRLGFTRNFSFDEDYALYDEVEYNARAKVRAGAISALCNINLGDIFFVVAGLGVNLFKVDVEGEAANDVPLGDVIIKKEKIGNFDFTIKPGMKLSPYLGIGFGHTLGKTSRWGFVFDMGAYYQGKPNVVIETSGLLSPTSNPSFGQETLLEHQISQYYLYPILRASVSYKLKSRL